MVVEISIRLMLFNIKRNFVPNYGPFVLRHLFSNINSAKFWIEV